MSVQTAASPFRYGVFLRPDHRTCALLTDLHLLLRQQYGLVSCAAYPPHATLAGNVPTDAPEGELADRIGAALSDTSAFTAYNTGIEKGGGGIGFNLHDLPDGSPNPGISVNTALAPVSTVQPDFLFKPFDPAEFRAHLSVASHELTLRPDLYEETGEFLDTLDADPPKRLTADTISLFRFHSDDWNAQWWRDMTWVQVRSWRLGGAEAAVTG
ncbi:hypothetical protein [Streptomyces violaceusniger]|uniref:2'-5' RNA ligase family protein n=1 Tax=Streptomyces violaceusniger (strain Tu 4113) TaxID=653045 RepID=G2PD84_STRV4|nr:hypothetical protein [Streptomyces violaceusniger]AEM80743.1 hypothetical protein Strvi_0973 [Streptomyces violaceusniger Tu 4113]